MWSFYLFVAIISFIYGDDNDYQDFGADLPINLAEHMTAIYNNELYVIGGFRNTSFWNTKAYKLSLSGISLSGTADITGNSGLSWSEVTFTGPNYGPASTSGSFANKMACKGQCYAQIGQYLYIVGPYTQNEGENTVQDTIYRLDLATMTFSASDAFESSIGYTSTTSGQCVTVIDDVLYTVGGANTGSDLISYTPSTDTQGSETAYPGAANQLGRFYSGCGGGEGGTKLWLLGGGASPTTRADDYEFSTDTWTIRGSFDNEGLFDTGFFGSNTASRSRTKCLPSLYDDLIECVGGIGTGIGAKDDAVRYNTAGYADVANDNSYSDLLFATSSNGFNSYQLLDDGQNAAELMIVTGGYDASGTFTGEYPTTTKVQYAVRYYTVPGPTPPPTPQPTDTPSSSPTMKPTQDPTCAGCTRAPSGSPTTAAPSEQPTAAPEDPTGGDSKSAQLCIVVSIILALISVIIV